MKRIIQCSTLGNFGGWGNMLFQYSFIRAYAEKYKAELEIPYNWIGRKIFKNIDHNPISKPLPKTKLDIIPWGRVNIDLFGYFQFKKCYELLSYKKIRSWLVFKDKYKYSKLYDNYIACHLRRGDYETKFNHIYCIISKESYIEAIKKYNLGDKNVIYVSDSFPNIFDSNCEFDFLYDFSLLMNADVLFRSNSTFSLWAGILGNNTVYSPIINNKVGHQDVEFSLGNHNKILDDYHGGSPQEPSEFIFND